MTNDAIVNYLNDLITEWWNIQDHKLFGDELVVIANKNLQKTLITESYTHFDDVSYGEVGSDSEYVICDGIFINGSLIIDFYPDTNSLVCQITEVNIRENSIDDFEESYIHKKLKLVIKDVVKYLKVFVNNYDFKNNYSNLTESLVQFTLDYMLNSKQEVFDKKTFWSDYE